jgi:hypothetical protein
MAAGDESSRFPHADIRWQFFENTETIFGRGYEMENQSDVDTNPRNRDDEKERVEHFT